MYCIVENWSYGKSNGQALSNIRQLGVFARKYWKPKWNISLILHMCPGFDGCQESSFCRMAVGCIIINSTHITFLYIWFFFFFCSIRENKIRKSNINEPKTEGNICAGTKRPENTIWENNTKENNKRLQIGEENCVQEELTREWAITFPHYNFFYVLWLSWHNHTCKSISLRTKHIRKQNNIRHTCVVIKCDLWIHYNIICHCFTSTNGPGWFSVSAGTLFILFFRFWTSKYIIILRYWTVYSNYYYTPTKNFLNKKFPTVIFRVIQNYSSDFK